MEVRLSRLEARAAECRLAGWGALAWALQAKRKMPAGEMRLAQRSMTRRTQAMHEKGTHFIKNYELARMASYSNYPESLLQAMQVKSLVGPRGPIADQDISVSAFRLEPGTVYGGHVHPHPEVYIFLAGTAECEWGDETFTAEPGTVTHCPPTCRMPSESPAANHCRRSSSAGLRAATAASGTASAPCSKRRDHVSPARAELPAHEPSEGRHSAFPGTDRRFLESRSARRGAPGKAGCLPSKKGPSPTMPHASGSHGA